MKSIFGFMKTTLFGGIVFLTPVVILLVIIGKAFEIMKKFAEPLVPLVPMGSLGGILAINLLAILSIVLVCFLAGFAAKSVIASKLVRHLETSVLSHIPFYAVIKGMTASMPGAAEFDGMKTVLARLDDYSQIAFEIERLEDGNVCVFLPGAPNAWSGAVCIMTEDRIQPLNTTVMAASQHLRRFGRGSEGLLTET